MNDPENDDRHYITWRESAERKGGLRVVLVTRDGRVWRAEGSGYAATIDDVGLYEPHHDCVLQQIDGNHSVALLVYPKSLPSMRTLKSMGRALFKASGRA